MSAARPLSTGEWSVLGLLHEAPAHGWALATALAPEGEIGAVWSLKKALVYRALDTLQERGLVAVVGAASSARGPSRTVYEPTRKGRAAVTRWLDEPVPHIRDLRPDLLLKLVFARRAGRDATGLLDAQRTLVALRLRELEERLDSVSADGAILLRYRVEAARAALRFVEAERDQRAS